MDSFSGKTVFITGGDRGMGLQAATMAAERGAHVAIFSRSAGEAAEQAIRAAAAGPAQRVARYALDVADRERVQAVMAQAEREFGSPDVVICMAGYGGTQRFVDIGHAEFDRMMQVNLYGTRHVIEAVLPGMLARGHGTLVPVGSLGGFVPVYGYSAYGTTKFALTGMISCLRAELAPLGVRVCFFCPGQVDTPGLAAEALDLLPAAGILKAIGGTLPATVAVGALMRGIERGRFLIIPGWRAKLVFWMYRLTPTPLWNAVSDALVRVALRRAPSTR